MRTIFLCEKSHKIFKVYGEKTVCELQRLTDIEKKIYSKTDVLAEPSLFSEVEFIFSTWGMPRFTIEEIKNDKINLPLDVDRLYKMVSADKKQCFFTKESVVLIASELLISESLRFS